MITSSGSYGAHIWKHICVLKGHTNEKVLLQTALMDCNGMQYKLISTLMNNAK